MKYTDTFNIYIYIFTLVAMFVFAGLIDPEFRIAKAHGSTDQLLQWVGPSHKTRALISGAALLRLPYHCGLPATTGESP